jgi:hypothetical protein
MIDPNRIFKVKGDLYKIDSTRYDNNWFQWRRVDEGTVMHIEGKICHAVNNTYTYVIPLYDVQSREDITSRDITVWVPYDSTQ